MRQFSVIIAACLLLSLQASIGCSCNGAGSCNTKENPTKVQDNLTEIVAQEFRRFFNSQDTNAKKALIEKGEQVVPLLIEVTKHHPAELFEAIKVIICIPCKESVRQLMDLMVLDEEITGTCAHAALKTMTGNERITLPAGSNNERQYITVGHWVSWWLDEKESDKKLVSRNESQKRWEEWLDSDEGKLVRVSTAFFREHPERFSSIPPIGGHVTLEGVVFQGKTYGFDAYEEYTQAIENARTNEASSHDSSQSNDELRIKITLLG